MLDGERHEMGSFTPFVFVGITELGWYRTTEGTRIGSLLTTNMLGGVLAGTGAKALVVPDGCFSGGC